VNPRVSNWVAIKELCLKTRFLCSRIQRHFLHVELIDTRLVKKSTPYFVTRMLLFLNERASQWTFFWDISYSSHTSTVLPGFDMILVLYVRSTLPRHLNSSLQREMPKHKFDILLIWTLQKSTILWPPLLTNQFYTAATKFIIFIDTLSTYFSAFNNPSLFHTCFTDVK